MTEKYNREKKRKGRKYISRNKSQTEIIYRLKNIFIRNIVKDVRFIAICLRNNLLMLHNLH